MAAIEPWDRGQGQRIAVDADYDRSLIRQPQPACAVQRSQRCGIGQAEDSSKGLALRIERIDELLDGRLVFQGVGMC